MKITIEIDATPQEVRDFFGFPNIQPLHNEMMQKIRDNMAKDVTGFDALTLMKPFLPAQMQTMESMHNAFWNAFANSQSAGHQSEHSEHDQENEGSKG